MGEEVKQDKYQEETLGGNDPVAAFLALKSITGRDNKRTKLRKLGNILGVSQTETWPYKGKSFEIFLQTFKIRCRSMRYQFNVL